MFFYNIFKKFWNMNLHKKIAKLVKVCYYNKSKKIGECNNDRSNRGYTCR